MLAAQVRQPGAGGGDRDFRGLQFLGGAIGGHGVPADLVANGGDLRLQCLQLRLGLGLRGGRKRRQAHHNAGYDARQAAPTHSATRFTHARYTTRPFLQVCQVGIAGWTG